MDEIEPPPSDHSDKQEMLQRMARRKGRKLKARANSKGAIRTWAEYSGVNLEPTGSYSKYSRWGLLIISMGLIPMLFLVFAGHGKSINRDATVLDALLGYGLACVVIFAGVTAGLIVVYSFIRAIIEANQR